MIRNKCYLCTRNQKATRFWWHRKGFLEIFWKSFQNIWWFQKSVLSLRPLSPLKRRVAQKVLRKIFFEKVSKIFGGFKNMSYLCTTFRSEKMQSKSDTKNGSLIYWFLYWEKKCSIYLSISLEGKWNSQDSNKTFYFFTMESLILAQDER